MQKKKVTFKHRLEYLFFMAFVLVLKLSPWFLLKFNKRLLAFLGRRVDKRHYTTVKRNLEKAFPENTDEQNEAMRDAVYKHFSSIATEVIYMYVKKHPEKILKPIEVNNIEVIEKALAKNKGALLFSAHFGNWELIPRIVSQRLDLLIASVAREMDNPLVEDLVLRSRKKMGTSVIYNKSAIRTILDLLGQNRIVMLLIDQNTIEREAVFVKFFGHTVSAVPSIARIHLKKGTPLVPMFLHYEKDKIVLDFMDEISFAGSGDMDADTIALTQHCTTLIEDQIRKYPEQWLWFHDRWRTQPTGKGETDET